MAKSSGGGGRKGRGGGGGQTRSLSRSQVAKLEASGSSVTYNARGNAAIISHPLGNGRGTIAVTPPSGRGGREFNNYAQSVNAVSLTNGAFAIPNTKSAIQRARSLGASIPRSRNGQPNKPIELVTVR